MSFLTQTRLFLFSRMICEQPQGCPGRDLQKFGGSRFSESRTLLSAYADISPDRGITPPYKLFRFSDLHTFPAPYLTPDFYPLSSDLIASQYALAACSLRLSP